MKRSSSVSTKHVLTRLVRQVGDTFYVLEEGCAVVTQRNKAGAVRELRRLREYACFGEKALLLTEPRSANVIAETKVHLIFCVCTVLCQYSVLS